MPCCRRKKSPKYGKTGRKSRASRIRRLSPAGRRPWPAVAAFESIEFVPSAADRRTSSGGRRTRLLFRAHFSEADRCIVLPGGRRQSPHITAAVDGRRLTPDFQTLRFGSLFRLNYAHFSQNTSKY